MNILVTGATGFIGKNLVDQLVAQGEKVHILCRSTSDISGFDNPNIEIFRGNILEMDSISTAMRECDRVYHMAALAKNWAPDPDIFYTINVEGTKKILGVAENLGVKKVVITSTSMTLKSSTGHPVSEKSGQAEHILTEYARSKAKAEEAVLGFCDRGLPVVFVNPTRVFGPGLMTEGNSATLMVQLYMQGKWRYVLGDGNAIGNYAYVTDVVLGHIRAMEKGGSGELYILGGENLSFNDFFVHIKQLSGIKHHLFHIPLSVIRFFAHIELTRAKTFKGYPLITPEWVQVFSQDWEFSSAKAEKELGYVVTPFREAIKTTINWIKDNIV